MGCRTIGMSDYRDVPLVRQIQDLSDQRDVGLSECRTIDTRPSGVCFYTGSWVYRIVARHFQALFLSFSIWQENYLSNIYVLRRDSPAARTPLSCEGGTGMPVYSKG